MRKKIIIVFLSLLFIGIASWLFYHQKEIRCLRIHKSDQFQQIQSNLFVSKDTPPDTTALLKVILQESLSSLNEFWGPLQSNSTILYCHSKELYEQYGMPGTPACNLLGKFAIISRYGVKEDIISHELCHSEIFSRIGGNYYKYYYQLPCWLDEGIALQFDHRGIYPQAQVDAIGQLSLEELQQIDRPQDFYLSDYKQTTQNYLKAKAVIAQFIQAHSKIALLQLLEDFRKGSDIYELYSKMD